MAEFAPIRILDEAEALAWLRTQPGGRTSLPAAELGRRWGWPRSRVGRRLKAWKAAGYITRRRRTITATDGATGAATSSVQRVDRTKKSARLSQSPVAAAVAAPPAAPGALQSPATDAGAVAATSAPPVAAAVASAPAVPSEHVAEPSAIAAARAVFVRHAGMLPARPGLDGMAVLAIGGAGILACFSTVLCVLGFVTMFPGMPRLAMGIGAGLEFVRLVAIAFAGRCWREIGPALKPLLLLLILTAETVSVVSVYSQLTAIHNGARPVEAAQRDRDRTTLQARIERQQAIVAGLDQRLSQLDKLTAELVGDAGKRGKINGAQDVIARQAKDRFLASLSRDIRWCGGRPSPCAAGQIDRASAWPAEKKTGGGMTAAAPRRGHASTRLSFTATLLRVAFEYGQT
jgi:hypothetical protein